MRGQRIIFSVLIGIFLFGVMPVHARLFSNNSEGAWDGSDGTSSAKGASFLCLNSIEELIIKGAEYFFKAQADINYLSENTEIIDLYGADFYSLWQSTKSAMENLNMARYYYQELQEITNRTPYNQVVINKLKAFDYDLFQEQNGLLKDVFSEVKGYLKNGDVRGIYSRISTYFDTLTTILNTIKEELYAGKVPANAHMWNLNQACVKAHMFGQYVAMVFYAIK